MTQEAHDFKHVDETSRREFITTAAGVSAVALSRTAYAQKSPNDQIVLGLIGVGGQGTYRLREFMKQPDVRIAAICDVDRQHLDSALSRVASEKGYKPQGFGDFRKLLEIKDLDAVTVVTPDHWHALATIAAFEAGKDVFVEKPLSYSVAEGRAMADASLNHKKVTQMGNHIHNDYPNYRRVVEMVRSGKLGKITRVHAWKTSPTKNFAAKAPATLPPGYDYDFWLGPAPKRPYDPLRSHGTFRQFWDYSGGSFIDFWCHISDVAFWAMDFKTPSKISALGGRFFLTDRTEAADTMEVSLEFPGVLYLYSFRPTPLPGFEHMGHIGCVFEGSDASLVTNYEAHEIWVNGKRADDFPKPPQSIPDSPGHAREFIEAVKTRNLETTCNVRYGHHLSKFGLLSNISYRTGQTITWDEEHERIVDDKKANHYLSRDFRRPWRVKTQPKPMSGHKA
jgi:predicted dehydrogenase